MSEEQWQKVISHTLKQAAKFGEEILEGSVGARPYRMGGETGCDYCGLHGICGMERGEFAERCRNLEEKTEQERWEDFT